MDQIVQRLIEKKKYREIEIYLKVGFDFDVFDVNGDSRQQFGSSLSNSFDFGLFYESSLLKKLQNINATNENGYSALSYSVINNNLKSFNVLVSKGADLNIVNDKSENLFHLACKYKSKEILIKLLKLLPLRKLSEKNYRGFTPFLFLCSRGQTELINEFIDILPERDLLIKNDYGAGALHWIAYNIKSSDSNLFLSINKIKNKIKRQDMYSLIEKNAVNYTPQDWLNKNNIFDYKLNN